MNSLKKWIQSLTIKSNKGSSIITVIIATAFIGILGTALLYSVYNGTLVKVTAREGVQNFYDAQSTMEVIKTAINKAVSDAANEAFTNTMMSYSNDSKDGAYNFNDKFSENFFDILKKSTIQVSPSGTKLELFATEPNPSSVKMNGDTLKNYLSYVYYGNNDAANTAEIAKRIKLGVYKDSLNDYVVSPEFAYDEPTKTHKLEEYAVQYTDSETGHVSRVTADIIINIPETVTISASHTSADFLNYAIIGENTFQPNTPNISWNGNVYVKQLDAAIAGSSLNMEQGTVTIAKNMNVKKRCTVTMDDRIRLWVHDISVTNASLTTNGNLYVKDDLELNNKANVTLKGNYKGFGNSDTDNSASSAILVNGVNTSLNLQDVNMLSLSGQSFVFDHVLTGESISIQCNQKAYLVPIEFLTLGDDSATLTLSNPMIISDSDAPASVNFNAGMTVFKDQAGVAKTFEDYGISSSDIMSVFVDITGDKRLQYFFLKFDNVTEASKYFTDYFNNNKEILNSYMNMYLSNYQALATTNIVSSGVGLIKDGTSYVINESSLGATGGSVSELDGMYDNMCIALSTTSNETTATNPYDYLLDEGKVNGFGSANGIYEFKDSLDHTVGLLVKDSNFTFNTSSYPDVSLLLTGPSCTTLTVNGDFHGLILSKAKISASNAAFHSDKTNVRKAFLATKNNVKMSEFFNIVIDSASNVQENQMWDLDEICQFTNWKKYQETRK